MENGSHKRVLQALRDSQEEMVRTLEELTNIDSPSTDKTHMDRFSAALAAKWKENGATVHTIEHDKYGNHLKAEWGDGEGQVLVLCHMDTVWAAGETAKRPFRVEDGKGYGPGAYDMKGGIVEALYAVKVLSGLGLGPKSRVVVLCNSDEEIGSPSSRPLIEDEARKSKAVLVLEPSAQGGSLKTWRKGVGMFEVTIRGRAAHAGADYEKGVSAAQEAAHQILHLHNLTDLDEGTTVNVGIVRSGTRRNVVAEEAILGIDLRVKTQEAANRVIPKILGLKAVDPRVSVSVKGELNRPPMERNQRNLALFQLARSIGQDMGIALSESGTGGGSDGNFTSALGIPTLDGLGPHGDDAHSTGEYVLLSSLPERAAVIAGLLLNL
ncbi:MAG: M20 family metallopeptidase [Bacillota bacterium]|jgi:glutamate carboxypeptidase|nr:M20 family metallopeptidase [Candidatus Fermentithermobacillaceae bacterium]